MKLLNFLLVAVSLFLLPHNLKAENNISINNLEDYVWLNEPKLSPDGEKVVFIKRIADFEDNKYQNTLYIYDLKTKNAKELINDKYDASALGWGAADDYITFLAADESETTQVFKILPSGGDPQQITNHETSIVTYVLSPDGKSVAFMAKDKKQEKTGEDRHLKSFEVGYDWYLANEAARPIHLWIYTIDHCCPVNFHSITI